MSRQESGPESRGRFEDAEAEDADDEQGAAPVEARLHAETRQRPARGQFRPARRSRAVAFGGLTISDQQGRHHASSGVMTTARWPGSIVWEQVVQETPEMVICSLEFVMGWAS